MKEASKKATPMQKNGIGIPFLEHSTPRSYITLPTDVFGKLGNSFVLQADGNGMANAGIHTGDLLIFDAEQPVKDGDIVMLEVGGEPMCRRVFTEGSKKRIHREDGVTPDIVTEECVVYAVLVGLMRNVREDSFINNGRVVS